jgi:hypothetical protein
VMLVPPSPPSTASLGEVHVSTKARALLPPPPPPPPPASSEPASSFALSPLAEVPSSIESGAPNSAGQCLSGSELPMRYTITSLQQISPQVIDSLLDMLVSRLRSSCVVRCDATDASMGLAPVGQAIKDGNGAIVVPSAGSGTSVADSSSSGSMPQVSSSPALGQHQQASRLNSSHGSWYAVDGTLRNSGTEWPWR